MTKYPEINENTLLISDLHLDHQKILKFCPERKYLLKNSSTVEEALMKNIFLKNKNKTIFNLGDHSFKGISKYDPYLKNTNNILLLGNHDKRKAEYYLKHQIDTVIEGVYIKDKKKIKKIENKDLPYFNGFITEIKGVKILFSHFTVFNNCVHDKTAIFYKTIKELEFLYLEHNCDLNIHGHTHQNNSSFKNSFNVSIDNIGYKPISIKEILKRV
jgi:calcineurin-like phosphoesterase family protein